MARPSVAASARIRELHGSLERARQLACGETLSARPMAKLIGCDWTVLRKWCKEIEGFAASGCFEFGERGAEYTFEPRATLLWLIRHFETERDKLSAKAERIGAILGDSAPAADGLSLPELKQALDVSLKVRESQIRDGTLVSAAELRNRLGRVFSEIQMAGARTIQELDPEGSWSPQTREIAENVGRTMLLRQQGAAENLLRSLNGGSA